MYRQNHQKNKALDRTGVDDVLHEQIELEVVQSFEEAEDLSSFLQAHGCSIPDMKPMRTSSHISASRRSLTRGTQVFDFVPCRLPVESNLLVLACWKLSLERWRHVKVASI